MHKHSFAIGLLAAMSIGSAAAADSYFMCMNSLPKEAMLDLGTVTSDGDGVVEVFDYHLGQKGESLGTVDVNQGANTDVRLDIGMPPLGDMLATLTVDGEIVATNVYDVCNE